MPFVKKKSKTRAGNQSTNLCCAMLRHGTVKDRTHFYPLPSLKIYSVNPSNHLFPVSLQWPTMSCSSTTKEEATKRDAAKEVLNQKAIDPNVSCFTVDWLMLVSIQGYISNRSSLLVRWQRLPTGHSSSIPISADEQKKKSNEKKIRITWSQDVCTLCAIPPKVYCKSKGCGIYEFITCRFR